MDDRELTYKIQGCIFEVSRTLGAGFLEAVYQRALLKELTLAGLSATSEQPINVYYKGDIVGEYRADIIVKNRVLLELKAQTTLPLNARARA